MPFQLGPDRKGRWIDVTTLVFIDEIRAKTNMTLLYGRVKIGRRVIDFVPHGHWQMTTFLAYVQQILMPTLEESDIVVMDNLRKQRAGNREKDFSLFPAPSPLS